MGFRPSGAVFDCDGLLVDTEGCWHAAYRAVFEETGTAIDRDRFAAFCAELNGASVELAADHLARTTQRPVSAPVLRRALRLAVETQQPPAMPGAGELLTALRRRMPLAVASNAPRRVLEAALGGAGLHQFFSHLVSAEEVGAPKPAPDVYREACRRLGIAPESTVAFEDSELGAGSARAAGLFLVAVPSAAGTRIEADLTVSSLADPGLAALLAIELPLATG